MDEKDILLNPHPDNKVETLDLGEIFWRYFSFWRWILLSVLVSLVFGFLYFKMQPNVYQVSASVLVKSPDDKGGGAETSMLEDLGLKSGGNVENEVEVFRSKRLLVGVVDSLDLNVSYYYKTLFRRLHELYTDSPVRVHFDKDLLKELEGSALVLTITPSNSHSYSYDVSGECKNIEFSQKIGALPTSLSTPVGVLYIEKTKGEITLSRPLVVTIRSTKSAVAALSIQSVVGKKNEVITLTTTSQHASKGIDVLNTLISSYNRDAMNQINQSAKNTAVFIDQRLKFLTVELSEVERSVERYKKNNHFTEISTEAAKYLTKTSELDKRRTENETQLRLIQFVEDFVTNDKNFYSPIPNLGLTDRGLSESIVAFNTLLINRSRISESSSIDNPVLLTLNKQILSLHKAILVGVKNVRKGLKIEQEDVQKADSDASSRLSDIPRQEREYIEIKRQQEIKAQLYVFLLQKREESALTMALTVPKAIVINEADLVGQVSPKRNLIFMVAFMLGLLIPLVVIYLLDLFNTKLYSRKEIESLTRVPLISEITHSDSTNSFAVSETALDSTTELFRLLRTKLNFVLNHPTEKVILITSTEPGEGKTFISINLALSLAIADKRVLLVGLDLRKPKLADQFNYIPKEGITSYLSGQERDINKLIFTSSESSNLNVLPAGIIPPNPNELLMRQKLDDLITKFKDEYDYIIIDSAPVGVVSDALLIDRVADVVLYVCRSGFTQKNSLDVVNRIISEKTISRMYLILNDLSFKQKYYKYNYGYSYGKSVRDKEKAVE